MRYGLLTASLFLLLGAPAANATTLDAAALVLDVPQSSIQEDLKTYASNDESDHARFVVQTASYGLGYFGVPSYGKTQGGMAASSRALSAAAFLPTSVPYVSGYFLSAGIGLGRSGFLGWKAGLGMQTLRRTGLVEVPGGVLSSEQALYVFPMTVGAEFFPQVLSWNGGNAYLGLALLPTMAIMSESALSQASVQMGMPVEAGLGVSLDFRKLWAALGHLEMDLNMSLTSGKVQELDMFGFTGRAGLRFPL